MADAQRPDAVVDLLAPAGTGPLWGMASVDLNATLLAWPPGHQVGGHVGSEVDVLIIVVEGAGAATVDDHPHVLAPGTALLIRKGSSRAIRAGAEGLRYLSVHKRRAPLQIAGVAGRSGG